MLPTHKRRPPSAPWRSAATRWLCHFRKLPRHDACGAFRLHKSVVAKQAHQPRGTAARIYNAVSYPTSRNKRSKMSLTSPPAYLSFTIGDHRE